MNTPPRQPHFEVVLFEPEIPNNTGNIGRTCLAMGASLHLIEPLGFDLSEKALRRAGLDYWPRLAPTIHPSWAAYLDAYPQAHRWYFTTRAIASPPTSKPRLRPLFDAVLSPGDHLVFGPETRGLPHDILCTTPENNVTFPMVVGERSLNLATAVCAGLTEGIRQLVANKALTLTDDVRIRHH